MFRFMGLSDLGRKRTMNRGQASGLIGKKDSLADLHILLHKQGFSYQEEIGDWKSAHRVLIYVKGKETIRMVRIARGKKGEWTGRRVGLVRTAGTADTYELRRG